MSGEFFTVGKLVNTHGIQGEVRVVSETDFPEERYKEGNVLYLFHPTMKKPVPLTIASVREHKNFHLLTFKNHPYMQDVEKYKGGVLKVRAEDRGELPEGEFYFQDIIGCEVFTQEGQRLGIIKEILQPGANDVWVVKPEKGKDILLPYIDEVIKHVDITNQRITVQLLEGLI
ncbi:ribosome maturation factor RimM [Aneurinibacillus aneurinilyticus]|uniref:Ribosome maturation factor RimM n=2 Tax=Aneurinibacillus aneurinilyticus TaxID=1391 RepID=A0A848CIW9_ANEAE|nr:ribosome maturation factor RimM [Aneurinibacillus aneurinilyticus]ERI09183.1 16S rRNA processing protein RimM [Aneurinibacillus aneurinilyticus ATCC 12856]MCI1692368.1 ribosome maturation factor RimM [Aneurinibacillus aneurinilyticus]MED0669293.1 ribosome maturation factor RimM [Aneurinibacillus aneurinilyticus]MED0707460.1 ribosome maturation factor RimM [Aneurinibacillus aneurinilyticus]MED0724732.1 ribosome maturation factor RimM [Aneurinibacillus aneurinilyticus]